MFMKKITETFGTNEPIFTQELLLLFKDTSRAQVFRLIDSAKEKGELIQYAKGIYSVPQKTRLGNITISSDDVIQKRYLKNEGEVYGVYGGIKLLNAFSVTTQMAATVEIITNNESSRCREIQLGNRCYILRKSRCEIDKSNAAAYTVMQLFSDMKKGDSLDELSIQKLREYIRKNGITQSQLFSMAQVFPARSTKMMIGSGIINGVIQ